MSFERTFQWVTLLLLLTGFLAVFAAGGVGPVTAVAYWAVLMVCWYLAPVSIANWVQMVVVSTCLAAFLYEVVLLSEWAGASIRLLLILSLLKVLNRKTDRDYLQVYLIALALLLMAATYRPSALFLIVSILFLFLSILALILFENRVGYQRNPTATFSLIGNVSVALLVTIAILLLALPIFLAIPRGSAGIMETERVNVTGFSEAVRLGEMGRILNSERVVMRVKVNRPADSLPPNLKWRGIALDYFDGRVWSKQGGGVQRVIRDSDGRFLLQRRRRQKESLLEQVFLVEPFSQVLFAAPDVIQISGLGTGGYRIWQDNNDAVSLQPMPKRPFRYFVHSDLQSREERLSPVSRSSDTKIPHQQYLQLPMIDERISRLAGRITEEVRDPVDKALRIEAYLGENFEYTLDNPSAASMDPLTSFLFQDKAGHCEYFASAQAVMLRALRIPTRIVNGFRKGEYNEWGDYFIVRAADAHSWVEAYFPGRGWVEFDPTPAAEPQGTFRLFRMFAGVVDSAEVLWAEILAYDRSRQAGFFQLVRSKLERGWVGFLGGSRELFQSGRDGRRSVSGSLWSLGLKGALAAVLLAVLYRYRRALSRLWKRGTRPGDEAELVRDYYLEMLDLLRARGFVKSRFETPAEFAERVSGQIKNQLPSEITNLYYQARFGGVLLDSAQYGTLQHLIRRLRDRS